MDWGHFGNWNGGRLYGFALVLSYSRMRYVQFTQRVRSSRPSVLSKRISGPASTSSRSAI